MAKPEPTPPGTRERLIAAMGDAMQRRGFNGIGLNEVLQQAEVPKGVLYHHFPGGKADLAVNSIEATVVRMLGSLDRLIASAPGPREVLASWIATAQKQLEKSAFEYGCPLATVALESSADDVAIRAALAAGFGQIRERLTGLLGTAGLPAAKAKNLAALMVAAYEGALMQARVAGDVAPLTEAAQALSGLVQYEIDNAAAKRRAKKPRGDPS